MQARWELDTVIDIFITKCEIWALGEMCVILDIIFYIIYDMSCFHTGIMLPPAHVRYHG